MLLTCSTSVPSVRIVKEGRSRDRRYFFAEALSGNSAGSLRAFLFLAMVRPNVCAADSDDGVGERYCRVVASGEKLFAGQIIFLPQILHVRSVAPSSGAEDGNHVRRCVDSLEGANRRHQATRQLRGHVTYGGRAVGSRLFHVIPRGLVLLHGRATQESHVSDTRNAVVVSAVAWLPNCFKNMSG